MVLFGIKVSKILVFSDLLSETNQKLRKYLVKNNVHKIFNNTKYETKL